MNRGFLLLGVWVLACCDGAKHDESMLSSASSKPTQVSSPSLRYFALAPVTLPGSLPGEVSHRGYYGIETTSEGRYRWAAPEAEVTVVAEGLTSVRLGGRSFGERKGQTVTLLVNGEDLGVKSIRSVGLPVVWDLPQPLRGTVTLRFVSNFGSRPSESSESGDDRLLSYRVYELSFESSNQQARRRILDARRVTVPVGPGADRALLLGGIEGGDPVEVDVWWTPDGGRPERVETQGASGELRFPVPDGGPGTVSLAARHPSDRLWFTSANVVATMERSDVEEPAECTPPSRVLVYVSDTTRADRVSFLGYELDTTPNLRELVDRREAWAGVLHTDAGWTLPSTATLLTGVHSPTHGVHHEQSLPVDVPYLPAQAAALGYATIGFSANAYVQETVGFARGFQQFHDVSKPALASQLKPRIEDFRGRVLAATEEPRSFVYVHSMGPHDPYQPPTDALQALGVTDLLTVSGEGIEVGPMQLQWLDGIFHGGRRPDPAVVRQISDLYDAEIWAEDRQLGLLISDLRERGLWEDTLFILTSDHGEEFGEHGGLRHGRTLYEEVLRVPLLVKPHRGCTGAAAAGRAIDFAPTVLSSMGAEPAEEQTGWNLRRGSTPDFAPVYAFDKGNDLSAIRVGSEKLIWGGGPHSELYDLSRDAGEHNDLSKTETGLHDWLQRRGKDAVEEFKGAAERYASGEVQMTAEQLEQLRLLGYLEP